MTEVAEASDRGGKHPRRAPYRMDFTSDLTIQL